MGLELRKVSETWEHPKDKNGGYIPLFYDYSKDVEQWKADGSPKHGKPCRERYMPDWPERRKTHFQMYENVTEGTPVSPVMASKKELAQWLYENLRAIGWVDYQYSQEVWLEILESDSPRVYLTFRVKG